VGASDIIYLKLEAFIKSLRQWIDTRNSILYWFHLYFLFYPFIEYFLWLRPMGHSIVLDICRVEVILFRFIMFPLFKLFKISERNKLRSGW
jgi:hypothetical protein